MNTLQLFLSTFQMNKSHKFHHYVPFIAGFGGSWLSSQHYSANQRLVIPYVAPIVIRMLNIFCGSQSTITHLTYSRNYFSVHFAPQSFFRTTLIIRSVYVARDILCKAFAVQPDRKYE